MRLSQEEHDRRKAHYAELNKDPAGNAARMHTKEALEKSKATREKTRKFFDLARYLMEAKIDSEDELLEELEAHGFKQGDYQTAVLWSQMKKAIFGGDTEAAKFVRDSAGFKPTEQLQVGNLDDKPFESVDLSKLSNDQLREMIAKRTNALE